MPSLVDWFCAIFMVTDYSDEWRLRGKTQGSEKSTRIRKTEAGQHNEKCTRTTADQRHCGSRRETPRGFGGH